MKLLTFLFAFLVDIAFEAERRLTRRPRAMRHALAFALLLPCFAQAQDASQLYRQLIDNNAALLAQNQRLMAELQRLGSLPQAVPAEPAIQPLMSTARDLVSCAVVCVQIHEQGHTIGGSATVIRTQPGRTILLSCAHLYEGVNQRTARTEIIAPSPTPQTGAGTPKGFRVLAIDHNVDLCLMEYPDGPLPYLCQVAPAGHRMGQLLSVGYDSRGQGKSCFPPHKVPVTFLRTEGTRILTREPPWHGRSGGALIDRDAGLLVGVVSAYTTRGPQDHHPVNGVYVSHSTVLRFLAKAGFNVDTIPGPQIAPAIPPQSYQPRTSARVEIPPRCWVANRTGAQCVWCSLATLGKFLSIPEAADLADRYQGLAEPRAVENVLRSRGVQFKQQLPGNRDPAILHEAVALGHGAAIGLSGRHMVTLVGVENGLQVIDNSDLAAGVKTLPLSAWDGWAVVLIGRPADAPYETEPRSNEPLFRSQPRNPMVLPAAPLCQPGGS